LITAVAAETEESVREVCSRIARGELRGTTKIRLSGNLCTFPRELLELKDSLEILDLSQNRLDSLPRDFGVFQRLRIFFASDNQFVKFPPELAECPKLSMIGFKSNAISAVDADVFPPALRWLILTNNRISALPGSIGRLSALEKLMLAGNVLSFLPNELALCQNLRLLRISANAFEQFPEVVLKLPRLAWLALAGNPFLRQASGLPPRSLPTFLWSDLTIGRLLGEGASGRIYSVSHHGGAPLALKIFKGAVTSDGYANDEIRAWLSIPPHPHLVKLEGVLAQHPEGHQGLVFAMIPNTFERLADPPSFDSCTRDVYSRRLLSSRAGVLQTAQDISSVLSHLHAQHVLHGDLYAHNILVDRDGMCLLGDFGAASLCGPHFDPQLFKIEMRALGALFEELCVMLQSFNGDDDKHVAQGLLRLAAQCQSSELARVPLPEQVIRALSVLRGE
jgi:hypothetical protein